MVHLIIGVIVMLALILSGMWIAVSIGIGGIYALLFSLGTSKTLNVIGLQCWGTSSNFVLACVPLFVFMGEFLSASGIIKRVYEGLNKTIAGIPGELQQTNIAACAVFAAASGSSLAGSATMGKIAYSELVHKRGYDRRLTLGAIAAGGTLGILIPPSIIMIVYGVTVEESIGQLFVAGIVPGLILTGLFMVYIGTRAALNPRLTPRDISHVSVKERLVGLLSIWPFLLLMGVVLGSIYAGMATPTEAAAIGATGSVFIAVVYGILTWRSLHESAIATVRTTGMIFLIVMCARLMGMALAYYGISHIIGEWAMKLGSPAITYLVIVVIYLILGCFFDSITMIVLTVPLFMPAVEALGFSKLWFGIVITVLMEAGLLTPPVGVNLFIMQGVTGESLEEVAKGALPFVVFMLLLLAVLYIWPPIATWLPGLLFK
jgi:C4-dicarboxylate transporter, DctM subunit